MTPADDPADEHHREEVTVLDDVVVLEIGDERVEPAGALLAGMGARVLKVEPPGGGPTRQRPPLLTDGRSLHWESWNAAKEIVEVDIGDTERRTELVAAADIVLVGLDDPAADGLDAHTVRGHAAHVVHVDITPFGRSGPYADHRAGDLVLMAVSGYLAISGRPGVAPAVPPAGQAWIVAGAQAALSAVVALRAGGGDGIEVAAVEVLAAQENLYSTYSARSVVLPRNGSQHRACAPGRIYPCRDGHVHIFVGAQKERGVWDRWLDWIGRPPELAGAHWQDIAFRKRPENLAVIDEIATRFFAAETRDDVVAAGQRRHIPIVAVLDPAEVVALPHVHDRGLLVHANGVTRPRMPWRTVERAGVAS
ncbi:hypothetical protein PSU4_20940 [Pseudonocardia sulfidoxydans NBRC 16205]|uniref:CoA transferase n=1 Tax=Pseudonocardia sulfidoxydans NBRC 16205 TaxID=1223511 RepID=A0A511DEA7_9PSEU|nr:CoA transferase [Pseudonocardia sulfidoxydans]GEL23140.1 hypothetical protein PSU4_20940 [Pseudonocardia sulfidoxydans NBRC 16205]